VFIVDFSFFQRLSEEFPQSAITACVFIILGSLLTNLFGYVKGLIESRDKRIEQMQDQKLDEILRGQQQIIQDLNGFAQRIDKTLTEHDTILRSHDKQLAIISK
jgi:hypothetical protein